MGAAPSASWRPLGLKRRVGAVLVGCIALTGCGGGSSPSMTSVAVTPATSSLTTGQDLDVTVTVKGPSGGGTVTVISGAFRTGAVALQGQAVRLAIPPGVLPVGEDVLTALYVPDVGAPVRGEAKVSVSAAAAPYVRAQSSDILMNGHPFQATVHGASLLVSVSNNGEADSQATGVNVYQAAAPAQLSFQCTQTISPASAFGLASTPNGANLAVAAEAAGVDVLNLSDVTTRCDSGQTLISQASGSSNPGTFDLVVTADGKYAFIANEDGVVAKDSTGSDIPGNVAVVALNYDVSGRIVSGDVIGQFSTGGGYIAGVALSPDGRRLYVTSEIAQPGVAVSGVANPILAHGGCVQVVNGETITSTYGLLSVVDVAKAESTPTAGAILATVAAGCSPVRVVETRDSNVIWVAVRGDNRVLAFSTHSLESAPDAALLGFGSTGGIAPVGLQLFNGERLIAVANSNRFAADQVGNMTIMAATAVNPIVLTTLAASYFPRNISKAQDDATLYLTDYNGGRVQIISTSTTPSPAAP